MTNYVIFRSQLPAGGAGITEAAVATTLNLAGVPFTLAIPAAVVCRRFAFWLPIVSAPAVLLLVRRLADELSETPLQETDRPLAELNGEQSGR